MPSAELPLHSVAPVTGRVKCESAYATSNQLRSTLTVGANEPDPDPAPAAIGTMGRRVGSSIVHPG
jgi:hypothetical protein